MDATVVGLHAGAGALAGALVFALLSLVSLRFLRREGLPGTPPAPAGATFLFEDESLIDATPGGRQLLARAGRGGTAWARLMQVLSPRFPGLEARLAELLDRGSVLVASADGRSHLRADWRNGLARLTLDDACPGEVAMDKLALAALEDELAVLRRVATGVPYLTWAEDAEGRITWANAAYLALAEAAAGPAQALPVWPPRALFPAGAAVPAGTGTATGAATEAATRAEVSLRGGRSRWFDLSEQPLGPGPGAGRLRTAMPADAIVAAETSRREFRQTLTGTFAALGAGLAVFDRQRRLILFNPALTDLTGLAVDFLVRKPLFESFAEQLRDARILPEPKNFNAWKQRVTRLLSEAERGTFAETWTLPAGRVFNVTGRPMPEGGIAFVIEDVSDEMRLTRHLRGEHELLSAALERQEAATCVYSGDGQEVCANAAWRRLWPGSEGAPLPAAQVGWRAASPEWDRAAAAPPQAGDPLGRIFALRLRDGRQLGCRMAALPQGGLMVQFTPRGSARDSGRNAARPAGLHPTELGARAAG